MAATDNGTGGEFIAYHEPSLVLQLTLISFLLFLSAAEWISDKTLKAGLIGQIAVGVIYGTPLGNILPSEWQTTFVSLGYLGLVLIIFEGGLTVRLDLLRKNFWLSLMAASIGVATPIGLCYLILFLGFGHGAIETFIVGAALSTTSLGTTFVTLGSAARGLDFSNTKIGTILISAAVLDDISGLVMASVTSSLGVLATGENVNIAWLICRPIVASLAMALLSPLLSALLFGPLFRRHVEHHVPRFGNVSNMLLMSLVLCAFITIAHYAGSSVLFGAFLAGTFLSSLPSTHPDGPFMGTRQLQLDDAGQGADRLTPRAPKFSHTFEVYLGGSQKYILQPLFFASMGFAIPFKRLWSGQAVWHGIIFSLAMVFAKMAVGLFVPMWDACTRRPRLPLGALLRTTAKPAILLGLAMVPRGEIGLLIIQIGFNQTPFLSEDAFVTAAWAIVLNTIIGPAALGLMLRWYGHEAAADERWGLQDQPSIGPGGTAAEQDGWGQWKRWTSRLVSRSVTIEARRRSTSREAGASADGEAVRTEAASLEQGGIAGNEQEKPPSIRQRSGPQSTESSSGIPARGPAADVEKAE
jgi:Kef-type K+ transport system membrane component KefB